MVSGIRPLKGVEAIRHKGDEGGDEQPAGSQSPRGEIHDLIRPESGKQSGPKDRSEADRGDPGVKVVP